MIAANWYSNNPFGARFCFCIYDFMICMANFQADWLNRILSFVLSFLLLPYVGRARYSNHFPGMQMCEYVSVCNMRLQCNTEFSLRKVCKWALEKKRKKERRRRREKHYMMTSCRRQRRRYQHLSLNRLKVDIRSASPIHAHVVFVLLANQEGSSSKSNEFIWFCFLYGTLLTVY